MQTPRRPRREKPNEAGEDQPVASSESVQETLITNVSNGMFKGTRHAAECAG